MKLALFKKTALDSKNWFCCLLVFWVFCKWLFCCTSLPTWSTLLHLQFSIQFY